jgi:hypothetical protein
MHKAEANTFSWPILLNLAEISVWNYQGNYVCEVYIGSVGHGEELERLQRDNKRKNRVLISGQFEVAKGR